MIFLPLKATISYTIEDMPKNAYCAYEHVIHQPGKEETPIAFVSWCKLHEVFNLTDAARNSEWSKLAIPGAWVYVTIIAIGSEIDCRNLAMKRINEIDPMPVCNMRGVDMTLIKRRIGCSNGETYDSQTDAARILNVPQSMISQNLSGKLKHVRGLKFWRVE